MTITQKIDFTQQVNRIKVKLELARITDKYLEVFGSKNHKYILDSPIPSSELNDFEDKYGISLPECYKTFLSQIGNGGINYPNSVVGNSGAGPYYGIFALGNSSHFVHDIHPNYLQKKHYFNSEINPEIWTHRYNQRGQNISDDEFDEQVSNMYAGILNIGYCGCVGYIGIMLNGINKGRVLRTYDELEYCPSFMEEMNFLDWYESWLDKILSGDSIFKSAWTFEKEDALFSSLSNRPDDDRWVLYDLSKIRSLDSISKNSLEYLREKYELVEDPIKEYILNLLIKFDYQNSKSELEQYYNNPIEILRIIHLFAPNKLDEWISYFSNPSTLIPNPLLIKYLNYIQTKEV